ncbi:hypothetical protein K438DRAFT_1771460 [Mycena galopus ATCC 62051]|nr:hypothetical protein K438DRAFT_1771460 [Mycena galopus ATCC 62051]
MVTKKKFLAISRQHKKELDNNQSETLRDSEPSPTFSCSNSESRPLEFPPSPTPIKPSSESDDFPTSIAVPARTTRASKRKSEATSDKPGPKPKAKAAKPRSDSEDSEPESGRKPAKKKPGSQPKSNGKATAVSKRKKAKSCSSLLEVDSDVEDVKIIQPALVSQKIVLMVPEAATEGSQRVSLKSSVSFEDAIELMHETIGCVSVRRKPTLAYKFSITNKTATTKAYLVTRQHN